MRISKVIGAISLEGEWAFDKSGLGKIGDSLHVIVTTKTSALRSIGSARRWNIGHARQNLQFHHVVHQFADGNPAATGEQIGGAVIVNEHAGINSTRAVHRLVLDLPA